jgi:hypothetical protein
MELLHWCKFQLCLHRRRQLICVERKSVSRLQPEYCCILVTQRRLLHVSDVAATAFQDLVKADSRCERIVARSQFLCAFFFLFSTFRLPVFRILSLLVLS